ncbi:MAG: hypothetical protein ACI9TB_002695 [Parasphingorhabdus sp.]|jgi:hypothetical protein
MVNHDFEILIAITALVVGIACLWIARLDAG